MAINLCTYTLFHLEQFYTEAVLDTAMSKFEPRDRGVQLDKSGIAAGLAVPNEELPLNSDLTVSRYLLSCTM